MLMGIVTTEALVPMLGMLTLTAQTGGVKPKAKIRTVDAI